MALRRFERAFKLKADWGGSAGVGGAGGRDLDIHENTPRTVKDFAAAAQHALPGSFG
jgi:hypothetical protein